MCDNTSIYIHLYIAFDTFTKLLFYKLYEGVLCNDIWCIMEQKYIYRQVKMNGKLKLWKILEITLKAICYHSRDRAQWHVWTAVIAEKDIHRSDRQDTSICKRYPLSFFSYTLAFIRQSKLHQLEGGGTKMIDCVCLSKELQAV